MSGPSRLPSSLSPRLGSFAFGHSWSFGAAVFVIVGFVSGCGSSTSCPAGSATCACDENQRCNTGLACVAGRCVVPSSALPADAGGTDDAANPGGRDADGVLPLLDVADRPADAIAGDATVGRDGEPGLGVDARVAPDSPSAGVDGTIDGWNRPPAPDGGIADLPQISLPVCGDGVVLPPEQCDDGNGKAGDGCSASCKLEPGFKCSGAPSICGPTLCGDGKTEGTETCDDGNAIPFDGCSADCQIEPACSATHGCTSRCGDGLVLGEACDDGNAIDGDGCSSTCKIEPGWTCKQPALGETMKVPAIYRDFKFHQPADFEAGASASFNPLFGIVKDTLDANGKPVYTGNLPSAHIASADSFAQWFKDVPGINHTTASKLTLWNDGKGTYVNRYGSGGEQWNVTTGAYYCGSPTTALLDAGGNPIPCTFANQWSPANPAGPKTDCQKMEDLGYTQVPNSCHIEEATYRALYTVSKADGNPLFFPVDNDTYSPASERTPAVVPPYYDASATWPYDLDADGNKRLHNFSFTSEIRSYFRYEKSKTYTLDFVGDDDLWVFIDGKLAADLGGIHPAVDGIIAIGNDGDAAVTVTATYPVSPPPTPTKQTVKLGLQDGGVYDIAVFVAERQSTSSSLKVTLPPFNTSPSECTPL